VNPSPNANSTPDPNDPNAVTQPTPDVSDGSGATPVGNDNSASASTTPVGENGQDNLSPVSTPTANQQPVMSHSSMSATDGTLYHVQAGSFQSQKNAKALEDALQNKGYAVMTVHQYQGGHDSYVVQVGAYSSSVTADQMVGNLQRDGFAASISRGM
jgi:cell division septation protein DedD